MKWFYAGLALALATLFVGLTSIVIGYHQVIGRYIRGNPSSPSAEKQKG